MRMTSVVCNVPVLSQNDSTYHHSVFTTWKWHPFATWTPSFIILVWGHHPPLRRTVFACLQNCYNSSISCSRSALRYDSINSNLMNYSWTNGRLAIPSTSWASCIPLYHSCLVTRFSQCRLHKFGNKRTDRRTDGHVDNIMPPISLNWAKTWETRWRCAEEPEM